MNYNNNNKQIFQPLLISLALVIGIILGYLILPNSNINNKNIILYPHHNKINSILELIDKHYVDTIDVDKLEEKVINEALTKLDPHSVYIPAKELKSVNEELSGGFYGIGVQFSIQHDTILVVAVIPGGPSEKVGLLAGDKIVTVNDSILTGKKVNNSKVMKTLRGDLGSKVTVGIIRNNNKTPLKFEITRGKIPLYSVDVSYMINDTTGYIKVNRFAANTYKEFMLALAKLKAEKCKKVIVDLRGNSGGYLEIAINMCNEFLFKGDTIVYTEGKASPRRNVVANGKGTAQDIGVTVLIDEFSASASEIFAGAIQDNDRGKVIGRRSFGKGLVQNQIPMPDGSALRLTIARYYTPAGRCIQKPYDKGVVEYYKDILKRYEHGEFFHKDSISQHDSIKYTTKNGRTVYGGGGIMPDIFVPRDTSSLTNYYYKIFNKGVMYSFSLDYTNKYRKQLSKLKKPNQIVDFCNKNNMMKEFEAYSTKEGVKMNKKQYNISKEIIKINLEAYIARHILDNEGFYPIIQELDNILDRAISLKE